MKKANSPYFKHALFNVRHTFKFFFFLLKYRRISSQGFLSPFLSPPHTYMLGQTHTQAHAFFFSGCKAWWTSGFQAQPSPPETKNNVIVWICSLEVDIWGIYLLSSNKWDNSNIFVHCVNRRLIAQIIWIIWKFLGNVCPVNTVIETTGHVESLHVASLTIHDADGKVICIYLCLE